MFAIGVTVVQTYRIEKDIALQPGQSVELQGYLFDFRSTRPVTGPNYDAIEADRTKVSAIGPLLLILNRRAGRG